MISKARTVEEYLEGLPVERREAIGAVRGMILKNLGKGFEEGMQYGMIGYFVPHSIYPAGYHCDPKQALPFMGLASQKNNLAVYMMFCYGNAVEKARFEKEWRRTGKKLDMGKACVRFKKLEDAALEAIGAAVGRVSVAAYVRQYEAALKPAGKARGGKGVRRPGRE